jgi:hypothetical protein
MKRIFVVAAVLSVASANPRDGSHPNAPVPARSGRPLVPAENWCVD